MAFTPSPGLSHIFSAVSETVKRFKAGPVLQQHVDLLLTQLTIAEKEIKHAESLFSNLEQEIAVLREQVAALEAENRQLEAQLQEAEPDEQGPQVEPDAARILEFLFRNNARATYSQISGATRIPQNEVQYHLGELERQKLVHYHIGVITSSRSRETMVSIAQDGRAFAIRRSKSAEPETPKTPQRRGRIGTPPGF